MKEPSSRKAGVRVVASYPHDSQAFTQGLFYLEGFLYESTGLQGRSSLRRVVPETGQIVQKFDLAPEFFGEGIVNWNNWIVQLTWTSHVGILYDLHTFRPIRTFSYPGEGWGLTQDGRHLIMSDGSCLLRILDPETFTQIDELTVTENGSPVSFLNDLQWVTGEIYANILKSADVVRIDPNTGIVKGRIDLSDLVKNVAMTYENSEAGNRRFLNGIAFDSSRGRLFVTGKLWPRVFAVELVADHRS